MDSAAMHHPLLEARMIALATALRRSSPSQVGFGGGEYILA